MARVALDADVLIAFLDSGDRHHEQAVLLLRSRLMAGEEMLLSASVYAEIMVRPLAGGTDAKVDEFLHASSAAVVAVDRRIALLAAQLRARHRSLRLPDALSLAVALDRGAELLTFDTRLARVQTVEQGAR